MSSLNLIFFGARNKTLDQIKKTLQCENLSYDDILYGSKFLTDYYNEPAFKRQISFATNIYPTSGTRIKKNFKNIMKYSFNKDIECLDFSNPSECAKIANKQFKEHTKSNISSILSTVEKDFKGNNLMVLINSSFFENNWGNKFDEDVTQIDYFYLSNGSKMETVFMFEDGKMDLIPDLRDLNFNIKASVLRLPYRRVYDKTQSKGSQCMYIILPFEGTNLEDVENKIDINVIKAIQNKLKYQNIDYDSKVVLYLPKFKIEQNFEVSLYLDVLKNIIIFF